MGQDEYVFGVKDQNIRGARRVDAGETGTIIQGTALQVESTGTVKIYAGGEYCGIAHIIRGQAGGVASALAGDMVGIEHWGSRIVYDSEDDTLALGEPLMPTGTAGKFRKWVTGVNGAELLAGYVERLKDADKKIIVRLVGGR